MKKTALIEKGKDGTYSVYSADTECVIVGEGDTKEEAIADFENALQVAVEFYAEDGRELPEDLKDVEFEYKLAENIFINND